jgi:hypothetical protein
MKRQPIINESNTFIVKGVTFLIYSTGIINGLWVYGVKNLDTGEHKAGIPYHKIKKYL